MTHPTCAADYEIVITSDELETFTEGRKIMEELRAAAEKTERLCQIAHTMGSAARETLDQIAQAAIR